MSFAKILIITPLFLFAIFLQVGFFAFFNIYGAFPNFVFILFFTFIFFERRGEYYSGIVMALTTGFLLDLFSPFNFGFFIISVLFSYFVFKLINHFLEEGKNKYATIRFLPLFLICFFSYLAMLFLVESLFKITPNIEHKYVFTSIIYNAIFAFVVFHIYKKILGQKLQENQLKLF